VHRSWRLKCWNQRGWNHITGAPAVCAVGQPVSDGCYGYTGWSGYAGAKEHAVRDGRGAGVPAPGAVARTPTVGTIGQPVSDGRYEQANWDSRAATIWHYEHEVRDDQSAEPGWPEPPSRPMPG